METETIIYIVAGALILRVFFKVAIKFLKDKRQKNI